MRILVAMPAALNAFSDIDWGGAGRVVAYKSGTLIALALLGLVLQFVAHRLIDHLVRRAEEGVLPDRIAQATLGRNAQEPPAGSTRRVQRAQAMGSLLKSITSGVIVAVDLHDDAERRSGSPSGRSSPAPGSSGSRSASAPRPWSRTSCRASS